MPENKFFLCTYLGTEKGMGTMDIWLSDGIFTRLGSKTTRDLLQEGDFVLCECEVRPTGFYTVAMAKVLSLKTDGVTPSKIKCVWGRDVSLIGAERIIDHRAGHKEGCDHN